MNEHRQSFTLPDLIDNCTPGGRDCSRRPPNQQLFEYRNVRGLGRGAFGTVYTCSGPISPQT